MMRVRHVVIALLCALVAVALVATPALAVGRPHDVRISLSETAEVATEVAEVDEEADAALPDTDPPVGSNVVVFAAVALVSLAVFLTLRRQKSDNEHSLG